VNVEDVPQSGKKGLRVAALLPDVLERHLEAGPSKQDGSKIILARDARVAPDLLKNRLAPASLWDGLMGYSSRALTELFGGNDMKDTEELARIAADFFRLS
jgi:hypothetical protein